jgi:hypothetical protein
MIQTLEIHPHEPLMGWHDSQTRRLMNQKIRILSRLHYGGESLTDWHDSQYHRLMRAAIPVLAHFRSSFAKAKGLSV